MHVEQAVYTVAQHYSKQQYPDVQQQQHTTAAAVAAALLLYECAHVHAHVLPGTL